MEYDRVPYVQDYLAEHGQYWPLYVLAVYGLVIVGGQRIMKVHTYMGVCVSIALGAYTDGGELVTQIRPESKPYTKPPHIQIQTHTNTTTRTAPRST